MVSEKCSCYFAVQNFKNMMSVLKNLIKRGGGQKLKNLELIKVQCKGIAACVYSLIMWPFRPDLPETLNFSEIFY